MNKSINPSEIHKKLIADGWISSNNKLPERNGFYDVLVPDQNSDEMYSQTCDSFYKEGFLNDEPEFKFYGFVPFWRECK